MNWIFEHNQDPDFNDPMPEADASAPASTTEGGADGVDEATVMSLVENLGCFTADQVRAALKESNGAADRAADWLFSHMDDLDGAIAALASKNEGGAGSSAGPKAYHRRPLTCRLRRCSAASQRGKRPGEPGGEVGQGSLGLRENAPAAG